MKQTDAPRIDHYRLRLASRHVTDTITAIEMYERMFPESAIGGRSDFAAAIDHLLAVQMILARRIQGPTP